LRKGLILTGFVCLLVMCLAAAAADTEQKLLGDESDGSRAHPIHLIPLFPENEDGERGGQITPGDDPLLPFSTHWTCGSCHGYGIISKGLHFNATDPNVAPGRPGHPWIFVDARTGTQIPLSYRSWPGTFKPDQIGWTSREFTRYFGRHMPGGGVGEKSSEDDSEIMREFISGKLEINCLSCHNAAPAHNQGQYFLQVVRENFRWAAAATCEFASVAGSAKDMPETYDPFMPEPVEKKIPPTVTYKKDAFDQDNKVFFDILREVPDNRCYFCHSNLYLDKEDTEKWSSDEDIHLKAGLSCVDCHRNGIDHNINRGYEGESTVSTNEMAVTSTCEGCHLGEKSSSEPVAGRLGAPVPEHQGIPPVHFEKLTCTACHSGPWPKEKTILTKTAQAHRLGTIGVNKSPEALPHINSPVFAKEPDGKIAPHKLIWPAFWGSMEGKAVTPIAFETVRGIVGKALAELQLPRSGDWPALTNEHINEALTLLQKSVESKAVYISGGKLYGLDDAGKLYEQDNHSAAQPYMWPIAHNVRPAAQALGVRYCTDCHATDAPFFFGDVTVDSPIVTAREDKKMIEFQGIDPFYAWAFAFSFVFRPWMKFIALGSCAVLTLVLLLYALKALTCVVKVLAGEN